MLLFQTSGSCCPSHLTQPHMLWCRADQGPPREALSLCRAPHYSLPPTRTCRHLHQGARLRRRKPVGWKATSCSANALKKKKKISFQRSKTHTNTLGPHITTRAKCGWQGLTHSHSPFSDKASPSWVSVTFISFHHFTILGTGPPKSFPQCLTSRMSQFY